MGPSHRELDCTGTNSKGVTTTDITAAASKVFRTHPQSFRPKAEPEPKRPGP